MEIPEMRTWVDGETVTPQMLNEQVRDALEFVMNPPACGVQLGASQSVLTSTLTNIAFDVENFDRDFMWSLDFPDYVYIRTPGLYTISARVGFNNNASGVRIVRIATDTRTLASVNFAPVNAYNTGIPVSATANLALGDVVRLQVFQDSGVTLSALGSNSVHEFTALDIVRVGS